MLTWHDRKSTGVPNNIDNDVHYEGGSSHSLTSFTAVLFLLWHDKRLTDKGHLIAAPLLFFISALFCYQKIGTHFFLHYVSLRILIWRFFFLHNLQLHALILLKFCTWNHSLFQYICLFVIFCLSTVDWPKEGHVKSWVDVTDIWFDSTTCAWDETFCFSFALYIYVYKWLDPCFHVFMSLPEKTQTVLLNYSNIHKLIGSRVCKYKD